MKKSNILFAAVAVVCGVLVACKSKPVEIKPVCCTIEEALGEEAPLQEVCDAMASLEIDDRYEQILDDSEVRLSVWCLKWTLISPDQSVSSNARGVMVIKDGKATAFPGIYHGHSPSAQYDAKSQTLRLACGEMEGTGIYVERLYLLHFAEDGTASIAKSIDPYDMQQTLCQRFGYSIDGQNISFYDKGNLLCCVTDSVGDMGGFDKDPIWIGEQLRYDVSSQPIRVLFMPGLKYVTGLVLNYDAMPLIGADVELCPDESFKLTNVSIEDELIVFD